MERAEKETRKVSDPGTGSVRVTIPKFIANKWNLEDGDEVEWDLKTSGRHAGKAFIQKIEEVD